MGSDLNIVLLPVYIALIAAFFVFFCWLFRRVFDPDGSMRELPLPGLIRWLLLLLSIFAPVALVWSLSAVLRGLTWIIS